MGVGRHWRQNIIGEGDVFQQDRVLPSNFYALGTYRLEQDTNNRLGDKSRFVPLKDNVQIELTNIQAMQLRLARLFAR